MKKRFWLAALFLMIAAGSAYGESSYAKQKKWIYAMASDWDAMEAKPDNCKAEYEEYNKIFNAIYSGFPGVGEEYTSDNVDAWNELYSELAHYWSENCPMNFEVSVEPVRLTFNGETGEKSYKLGKLTVTKSEKFRLMTTALDSGLRKAREKGLEGKISQIRGFSAFSKSDVDFEKKFWIAYANSKDYEVTLSDNVTNTEMVLKDGDEIEVSGVKGEKETLRIKEGNYGYTIKKVNVTKGNVSITWNNCKAEKNKSILLQVGWKNYARNNMVQIPGKDFKMLKTEVTVGLYEYVMGYKEYMSKAEYEFNRAADSVSWLNALKFCNKLSMMDGLDPVYSVDGDVNPDNWNTWQDDFCSKIRQNTKVNGYRLPGWNEWNYAAKGGELYLYAGSNDINETAWYDKNRESLWVGSVVASKKPNGYGLYDMCGNLCEWCWTYEKGYLDQKTQRLGGGGYESSENECEIGHACASTVDTRDDWYGFRVVCSTGDALSAYNIGVGEVAVANDNLRLRKGEATSSEVITTMLKGTEVKILQMGKEENIDDILSCWVNVEIVNGKDKNGKELEKGITGWCYGGYLDEVESADEARGDEPGVLKTDWIDYVKKNMVSVPSTKEYKVLKTEVTQGLFEYVMGYNPSFFKTAAKGEDAEMLPVETVNMGQAMNFCNKLSEMMGLTPVYSFEGSTDVSSWKLWHKAEIKADDKANGYRIPTDSDTYYIFFMGSESSDKNAWTKSNSSERTHAVGLKNADKNGLYDVKGNVSELFWNGGETAGSNSTNWLKDSVNNVKFSYTSACLGFRIIQYVEE